MKIQFGSLELELEVDKNQDILELKVKDLITSKVTVRYMKPGELRSPTLKTEMLQRLIKKVKEKDYTKDIQILTNSGLSNKTILMVANKVLGVKTDRRHLDEQFREIEERSLQWLSRPIKDDIWALYVAPIHLPTFGHQIAVVGLNKEKQLIVLSVEPGPPQKVFDGLIKRGLKADKVQIGIVSLHIDAKQVFQRTFNSASIAFDWQEYINTTLGAENKFRAKQAMITKNPDVAIEILKDLNGPPELLTHYEFEQKFWRVLKTTAPIKRLEKDLRAKLKDKKLKAPETLELVKAWSIIRLQYYWYKIPVDANQLNHLRYIQEQYAP